MKIDKTYKISLSTNRLFLGMSILLLVLLMWGDMSQAFSKGRYLIGSLDIILTLGVIHQWWTVWSKQIK